jgi:hypothetical protein
MKLFASLPSIAVASTILVLASSASAQPRPARSTSSSTAATTPTTKTADYTERVASGEQVVTFSGDELAGVENGAFGMTVRRPPGSTRVGLIRPRLNFVPELLSSVENL